MRLCTGSSAPSSSSSAIIGLITYSGKKETQAGAAEGRSSSRRSSSAAGLTVPIDETSSSVSLGSDGGAVCDNPASALGKATLLDQITNGADFVGRRPVIIDRRVLQGEALILEVYCPDELQEYKDKFDDLKTDDTLKD